MTYIRPILLFLLIILSVIVFAENNSNFSSRFESHQNIISETFIHYIDSVLQNNWTEPDSVKNYLNWLTENRDKLLETDNVFLKAYYFIESAKANEANNEYSISYENIDQALFWLPKQIFLSLHFKVLQLGKDISARHRDYATEIQYLKKLEDANHLNFQDRKLSDIMIDIANCCWNLHDYDQSMKYCNKVQPLLKIQDYKEGKIRTFLLMYHNAHFSTIDTTWLEYLDEALQIAKELGDSSQLANVYSTIGYSRYRENDNLTAINYYNLARKYEPNKGSASELGTVVMQQLSYTLIDSANAVNITSKYIIDQASKNNIPGILGNAYRGRAWYFAKTGKKDSASFYLDKAFEHRQSYTEKSKTSPGFYYYLHEVALMINDYERALKFLNISSDQVLQISRETNAAELNHNRAEIDYELQRERIEKLTLENNLEKERSKKQRILISGILLILLLVGSFLGYAYKKYEELKGSYHEVFKKNLELDKLNIRLIQTEEKLQTTKNGSTNGNGNGNGIKDEEKIYRKLKELLEKEKIYKQPDISSRKLAGILKTNTSYLSAIVNLRFDESLKTIINRYRINEARRLLTDSQYTHYSVEGIAEEVGYQSRSTFYQSFKQITGLTPTQYLENFHSK